MEVQPGGKPGAIPYPDDLYSEIGQMAKTHTDPVCGAVYSDWADDPAWGDDYLARICSLEPAHDGHHRWPSGVAGRNPASCPALYTGQQLTTRRLTSQRAGVKGIA